MNHGLQGIETIIAFPEGGDAEKHKDKIHAEYNRILKQPQIQEAAAVVSTAEAELDDLRRVQRHLNEGGRAAQEEHRKAHEALVAGLISEGRGDAKTSEIAGLTDTYIRAGAINGVNADALKRVVTRLMPAEMLRKLEAESEFNLRIAGSLEAEVAARTARIIELAREAAEFDDGVGINVGAGVSGELLRLAAAHKDIGFQKSREHRETRARYCEMFGGEF